MILDLERFAARERPRWEELENELLRLSANPSRRLSVAEARRLHYLYERASADLSKVAGLASAVELRTYLEALVARTYAEVNESRRSGVRLRPWTWISRTFPQTFRRRFAAFRLTVWLTLAGMAFGGGAYLFDPGSKGALMPFAQHLGRPSERVADEEANPAEGGRPYVAVSAWYMTHNTRVGLTALALGITWGIGTLMMLFYNGVILGVISLDYLLEGQGVFLTAWLLPHGAVEIPAILIAGQAGLLLGGALLGWGDRLDLRQRLRAVGGDVVTLAGGMALLLVWAGLVESFFSQHHEPVMPYWFKILFGVVELVLLALYLWRAGRGGAAPEAGDAGA